jgi:acyl-CoA reductase-like NAD-dependent aldehyde dehydrogenase
MMTELTLIPATGTGLPAAPLRLRHFIDGHHVDSADTTDRLSPSHATLVSIAAKGGIAETDAAIAAARRAFDDGRWSRRSAKARAAVLLKTADLIERHADRLALYETLESGKPITQARGEITGAADLWRYAASAARALHGDSHNTLGTDILAVTLKEPRGVVSIITPWNFPFWILSQKLPFALAAGCTCVVKPSEMTPATTALLADLLTEAGLPPGVCNIVLGLGDPVGARMTTHPDVDMVTFTGSTAVGRRIAATAGDSLKKVALELGGKNPQVIFPDSDIASAADAVAFGIHFNVGQCCNSGSRVIVHQDIAQDFTARVTDLSRKVAYGDPLDPRTQVGAIVTPTHAARIDAHVQTALSQGAQATLGGAPLHIPGLGGQFYAPTIVTGVTPDMALARDEIFGPVLSVLTFRTLDEAIALTNASPYGLSAGVWSDNIHTCLAFARAAQAGTVWTNTWMDGFPEVPFGGVKQSGLGREIGAEGLNEFLEVKSLVMRIGRMRAPWVNPA